MSPHLNHLPSVALIVPALGFVIGLIGAAFAWRGRRVGSHPTCRRCGYDLRGKPVGSGACPECGSGLAGSGATRVGRRVTRRYWLAGSLVLLIACGAALAGLGLGAAKGVDWNRHKPHGWLLREARGLDGPARDAALGELARRIGEQSVSDVQLSGLADDALAQQGDLTKPWVKGWGDVVEAARNAGRLPDDKWRRYARQAVVPGITLRARPLVRRGDPILTQIITQPLRAAAATFYVRWDNERPDQVSGRLLRRRTGGIVNRLWPWTPGGGCFEATADASLLRQLPEGPQTVRVPMNLVAYDSPIAQGTPLVNEKLVLTAPWTLVPEDAPAVRLRTDENLVAAVRQSIKVKSLTALENGTLLLIELAVDRPPVPLVMTAVIRSGTQEWQTQTRMFVDAGESRAVLLRIRSGLLPDPQTFDIVLKPDFQAASQRWLADDIWGAEIAFPGVKVIR